MAAVRPLIVTRPWRIISSAARREAIPAWAMSFCRRSSGMFVCHFCLGDLCDWCASVYR
jgi:hypothetical protein